MKTRHPLLQSIQSLLQVLKYSKHDFTQGESDAINLVLDAVAIAEDQCPSINDSCHAINETSCEDCQGEDDSDE